MSRWSAVSAVLLLLLATLGSAQPEAPKKDPPAVVELFEDDAEGLIANLNNESDASVGERDESTVFAGTCSLRISSFQKFNPYIKGWKFKIAEDPQPGEYRYLRFAWKRTEAPGIMLQLHAASRAWHRYYAGSISEKTKSWGTMI